jgi:hypothetical protein
MMLEKNVACSLAGVDDTNTTMISMIQEGWHLAMRPRLNFRDTGEHLCCVLVIIVMLQPHGTITYATTMN